MQTYVQLLQYLAKVSSERKMFQIKTAEMIKPRTQVSTPPPFLVSPRTATVSIIEPVIFHTQAVILL